MACNEINECSPCGENRYDNCGCLNPTTFECITEPGTYGTLGITNDMNGIQVLQQLEDFFSTIVIPSPSPGSDIYTKISSTDDTSDYLLNKIQTGRFLTKTVINPGGNEKLKLDVDPSSIISSNSGNLLDVGTDRKLRVLAETAIVDFSIIQGNGVFITGTGSVADPYIISINPSISAKRTCFDGVWRDITLVSTGTPNIVYISGTPQYRVRFDGTIEFRGSATYTVNFGAYSDLSGSRKRTATIGNISSISSLASSCGISSGEISGISDLKSINYIDQPGTGDQITQQYGYIIRKNGYNIILEFQSAFINATQKQIVINFEGCLIHPSI